MNFQIDGEALDEQPVAVALPDEVEEPSSPPEHAAPSGELREVEWRDAFGRRWVALLPAELPDDMASMGLQKGPVSLEPLGLPLHYEVKLHNELVQRGVLTWDDAKRNPGELEGAVRSVIRAGGREIREIFREATGGT